MSEQQTPPEGEAGDADAAAALLGPQGDIAFSDLMDTLVSEAESSEAGAGEGATGTDGAAKGQAAAAPEGAGAAKPDAGAPAAGADGKPAVPTAGADAGADGGDAAAGGTPPGGALPDDWTAPASEFVPKLGQLSTALEDKVAKAYHEEALKGMREEHGKYFESVQTHPRALVGETVPSLIDGKPDIVLKDVAEVEAWQSHLKQILVDELRGRTTKALEDNSDYLNTLHASIEIFQNNTDLIPGTKDFDLELANRFGEMAKPYEIRVEEKLHGYSIPTQGMIDGLRAALKKEREGKGEAGTGAAAAGAPAGGDGKPAAAGVGKEDQPQAGLTSKAGGGAETENYDTLFGTLGFDTAPRF